MNSKPPPAARAVSMEELRRIAGPLDEDRLIAILDLQPTFAEMEEAMMSAAGDEDVLARAGTPVSAKVAEIVDILTADDGEPQ